MFNWLSVELTNRCNKSCHFCGRAKSRNNMILSDMPLWLLTNIIYGFDGSMVQFNKDGEPLLYEYLSEVGELCRKLTTNIVTNGILLMERKNELQNNFDTITVSVFEDDEEQFETIKRFVESVKTPRLLIKYLGKYKNKEFDKLGIQTMRRTIHNSENDTGYRGSLPPVPEFGMCLDFMNKPSIDWQGNMYICNRFDPSGLGIIGDCKEQNLTEIWNNPLRKRYLELHKQGKREEIALCSNCTYWGVPTNG